MTDGLPILVTDRLVIRPLVPADATALHEACRDTEAMRYWSSAPHATVAETHAYLARSAAGEWRGWAITLADDDRTIGMLSTGERRAHVSELGYLLVRSAWGHGYAREAVAALLDLLFRQEGRRRVFADTDPDNRPSIALLESLGFRREGLLRAEWETHIGVRDTLLLGLLRDGWTR